MTSPRSIGYRRLSPAAAADGLIPLAWRSDLAVVYDDSVGPRNPKRPQLRLALAALARGDTFVIQCLDHPAATLEQATSLLRALTERGVTVECIDEAITFAPGEPGVIERELALLAAGARFVSATLAERQREGIEAARGRPRKYMGRKQKLGAQAINALQARFAKLSDEPTAGAPIDTVVKIAADFRVSRDTVYRYAKAGGGLIAAAKLSDKSKRLSSKDPKGAERTRRASAVRRQKALAAANSMSLEEFELSQRAESVAAAAADAVQRREARAAERRSERAAKREEEVRSVPEVLAKLGLTTHGAASGPVVKESGDE